MTAHEPALVARAIHDVTCPEGPDCRDRLLHSAAQPLAHTGVLAQFLARLAELEVADIRRAMAAGPGDDDADEARRQPRMWREWAVRWRQGRVDIVGSHARAALIVNQNRSGEVVSRLVGPWVPIEDEPLAAVAAEQAGGR